MDKSLDLLGHDEIDHQHRSLLDGIARLAVMPQDSPRFLNEWVRFIDEIRSHFEWEEAEMASLEYPDTARHRRDHRRQVAALLEHLRSFREAEGVVSRDVFQAMSDWTARHVRSFDREFMAFLREREVWDLRQELVLWESDFLLEQAS